MAKQLSWGRLAAGCSLASVLFAWASPAVAAPALPAKAEVVFSDDFEAGQAAGWQAGKVVSGKPADTKGALAATGKGLIMTRSVSFDATRHTYMTFRYYAEKCYSLGAQFSNKTRGDNFKTFIVPIRRGRWGRVTFNIKADIQGSSTHTAGIRAGDKLVNVVVWPMTKLPGAKLLIDDVAIYHLRAPARAARMLAELDATEKTCAPAAKGFAGELAALRKEIVAATTTKRASKLEARAADLRRRIRTAMLVRMTGAVHGIAKCEYAVGVESPLVRVSGRNRRMAFRGRMVKECRIAAAAREYENVQLIVMAAGKPLKQVSVSFTDISGKAGTIAKGNLQWRLARDVRTKPSYGYPRSLHGWKPDPILAGEPFDLKPGQVQAVWVTAYVPPDAKPGDYSGSITIAPANSHPVRFALRLRVWNYSLPLRGRFRHMCQFQPQSAEKRRESYAFLLKYRFSPTAQYSRLPSPVAEHIQFCLDRGITTFVAGNHPGPEVNVDAVKPYYEALKKAGCLDLAVIYIGDEGTSPEKLAEYRRKALTVKRNFPGLRVMVGGSTPRAELNDFVDLWDPIMSMTAGRGSGYRFHRQAVEQRKALGEEVLWYMAGVRPPYPSIELDPPAVSIRMFCWVTWKYGVGGWELYGTQGGWRKPTNKTWPKTPWDTHTWRTYNGSGQFVYPGPDGVPLASVRLENARDGIEDYESLALLAEAVEMARAGKARVKPALAEAAREVLAVRPEVVTDMWEWTRDPARIEAARAEASRTLDGLVKAIGRKTFDEFVAARAKARRKANNEAYQKRLKAFLAKHGKQEEAK